MKRVAMWRPPLWMVAVLMGCTLALGTGAGYVQGAANTGQCTESAEVCADFANFWEVWNIAEAQFLDPSAINPDDMIAGAINGMLDTLGDQGHTRYNTAEQFQRQQESLAGEFVGIGAYVNEEGGYPIIVAPIEGSPAEAAGIKAGDVVLEIDGESTEGLGLEETIQRIRGEAGTQVSIKVRHLGEEGTETLTITRASINIPAVTWTMLPGNVAFIKLNEFQSKAQAEMEQALADAEAQGAERIILDLRNNPGGLLEQAIGVTSQFLPEGQPVLRIRDRDGNEDVRESNDSTPVTDLPMVVLINLGSASSSEIMASALQDYDRATVIGVQTIGLGTVISPVQLDDGSAVYIGTAEWITPDGRQLRKAGVEPDITEALPSGVTPLTPTIARDLTDEEILQTEDTQIQRAFEVLGVNTTVSGPAGVAVR